MSPQHLTVSAQDNGTEFPGRDSSLLRQRISPLTIHCGKLEVGGDPALCSPSNRPAIMQTKGVCSRASSPLSAVPAQAPSHTGANSSPTSPGGLGTKKKSHGPTLTRHQMDTYLKAIALVYQEPLPLG